MAWSLYNNGGDMTGNKIQYFTKLHSANLPKNKLQEAVYKLLKHHSNRLIYDRETFVKMIKGEINHLNSVHPKCTALKCSSWESSDSTVSIGCGELFTVSFTIAQVFEYEK